jgi:Tfp pilus assembly protein PilV
MRWLTVRRVQDEKGDTIVEVLIAIAVISVVLVGAFLVSQRSSNTVQNSSEHSTAQQILQSQVERVRAAVVERSASADTINTIISSGGGKFCMVGDTPTTYTDAACKFNSLYTVTVTKPVTLNTTYKFTIAWDGITGGTQKEDLYYRVDESAGGEPAEADPPTPPAPAYSCPNISLSPGANASSVAVSITGGDGASEFRIVRGGVTIGTKTGVGVYSDTTVSQGQTYSYVVQFRKENGTFSVDCAPNGKTITMAAIKYVDLYLCVHGDVFWGEWFETLSPRCEGYNVPAPIRLGRIIALDSPVVPAGSKRIDRYYTASRSSIWRTPTFDHLVVATTDAVGSNMPWAGDGYYYEMSLGYGAPSGLDVTRYWYSYTGDNYVTYPGQASAYPGLYQVNDGRSDFKVLP